MNKLLRADFRRLWKSKIFYLGIATLFIFALISTVARIYEGKILREPNYMTPDGLLFNGIMLLSVVISIFVSMYIWTDGADGIWRNKVVVGCTKTKMFFSYWIVTGITTTLFHLVYIFVVLSLSSVTLDGFQTPAEVNVVLIFCSLLTVLAINSFVVLICSFSPNKALCVIFCVLFMMGLWSVGLTARSHLAQPKFFAEYTYTDSEGVVNEIPKIENSNYISGAKRKIVQFIADFLPTGQSYSMNQRFTSMSFDLLIWAVYSATFCLITASLSFTIFKHRDLK